MRKKIAALVLAGALSALTLTGCSGGSQDQAEQTLKDILDAFE